jgi:hypothetical protein
MLTEVGRLIAGALVNIVSCVSESVDDFSVFTVFFSDWALTLKTCVQITATASRKPTITVTICNLVFGIGVTKVYN